MVNPLLLAVAGFTASQIGGGLINNLIAPLNRGALAWANRRNPNLRFEISQAIELYHRGLISFDEYIFVCKENGLSQGKATLLLEMSKTLPTPEQLYRAKLRNAIPEEEYDKLMYAHGYKEDYKRIFEQSNKAILNPSEALTLLWREEITRERYYEIMRANGFDRQTADEYEKANLVMPSPSDVIRWSAREVFEPALREKFQLDRDLPSEFLEWAKKVGIPEEVARNYWASHWELPSWTNIVEMWHRGVIDENEVDTYFIELDMAPYWREKLKKIAFLPYTRVDVRRMYELGVLNREQVKRAYMDLGYDEEKAENLTRFTVAYANSHLKDLTQSQILKAYERGINDRDATKHMLMDMGYDENEAEIIIALKEFEMEEDRINDEVKTLEQLFKAGVITLDEVMTELDNLNLTASERNYYVAKMINAKKRETKTPSLEIISRWVKNGIIDIEKYKEYLEKLGYTQNDISNFVKEAETWTGKSG